VEIGGNIPIPGSDASGAADVGDVSFGCFDFVIDFVVVVGFPILGVCGGNFVMVGTVDVRVDDAIVEQFVEVPVMVDVLLDIVVLAEVLVEWVDVLDDGDVLDEVGVGFAVVIDEVLEVLDFELNLEFFPTGMRPATTLSTMPFTAFFARPGTPTLTTRKYFA